jgi:hypothetical protein
LTVLLWMTERSVVSSSPSPVIAVSTTWNRTGSPGTMNRRTIQFSSSRVVRLRTEGA